MRSLLLAVAVWLGATAAAQAMNVVATTTAMGVLASAVGGETVQVTVLAPPDRNAHYLQVRPSMMVALRRADLVVAVGASLEIGWLPPAIQGSGNPAVTPGRPGYFEAARQVALLDAGQPADRALGDVHPEGNPHIEFDPIRMSVVAEELAERMAALDPARAELFRANAAAFVAEIDARMPGWRERAAGSPGMVLYHSDANYLADRFDVPVLGYIEPLPGIPPSASHLEALVGNLRGRIGVILHKDYEPEQGPRFVADALGWPVRTLPGGVPIDDLSAAAYLAYIDMWVAAIAGGEA